MSAKPESKPKIAIAMADVVKKFGDFTALNKLQLTVGTGEVHGFLGPNGAGKSTTIRVLLGLLHKTSGHMRLLGGDPWTDAVELHRRIAYIPGDVSLWPNLTGGEAIDLLTRLRGGVDPKKRTLLLQDFDLDPTKKCGMYSKGNRQKVAIVAALAADAELYLFDEPTSGLDPLMQAVFQSKIRELKAAGKTILFSSHILAEVEVLCDRITIIKEGRAIDSGTLAELRHMTRTAIVVDTQQPTKGLDSLPGIYDLKVAGTHTEFTVAPDELDMAIRRLSDFTIRSLTSAPPTLEQLFMHRYYEDGQQATATNIEPSAKRKP